MTACGDLGVNALGWRGPAALVEHGARAPQRAVGRDGRRTRRLWAKDASLWTGADEAKWLGWLDALEAGRSLAADARGARRRRPPRRLHATRCCSAWAARACARRCSRAPSAAGPDAPELHVLDSTVPSQVRALEGRVDLDRTLVIVASKSGQHARAERLPAVLLRPHRPASAAPAEAARRFVAITDPGSKLEAQAKAAGFRHIVLGRADDRRPLLRAVAVRPGAGRGHGPRRRGVPRRDGADGRRVPARTSAASNPGVELGLLLGTAARQRPATSSRSSPRRASRGSARGSSSSSPSRRARTARRSSRSISRRPRQPDRYGARPPLRLPAARDGARIAAQDAAVDALDAAGAAGRPHRRGAAARHRPGVLPLGDRHRGRRAP